MVKDIVFTGHGANVVGSLGSGSLVQDMPSAVFFDESEDDNYVNVPEDASLKFALGDFTISCWSNVIYGSYGSSYNCLVGKGDGGNDETSYALQLKNDGVVRFHAGSGNNLTSAAATLGELGNWNHLTGVKSGNDLYIYVNGVEATSSTGTSVTTDNTTALQIGADTASSRWTNGNMRDVRIWGSGLTATEVGQVYEDINMGGGTATGSLVGWWKMEEGTGTNIADSSVEVNTGTLVGTTKTWDASIYNLNQIGSGSVSGTATISGGTWNLRDSTYLGLNVNGDYVSVADDSAVDFTSAMTLSAWLKTTDAAGNYSRIIEKDGAYQFYLYSTDGTLGGWISIAGAGGQGDNDSGIYVADGLWHHCVMTFDGDVQRFYVDGVAGAEFDITDGNINTTSNAFTVSQDGSGFIDGDIRDVRAYNTALTQSQIDLLYAGQWDGAPALWWKLNEGTGATATDSGTGGNDGTITDAAWVNPTYKFHTSNVTQTNALLVGSGTAIQAPRGVFEWNPAVSLTYIMWDGGTWYHNSGTWHTAGGTNANNFRCGTGAVKGGVLSGATFYNLSSSAQWFGYASEETHVNTYWIENNWHLLDDNSGFRGARPYGNALIFGTDTTSGTITTGTNCWLRTLDSGLDIISLEGKNELFPAVIDTKFQVSEGGNRIEVKNVDWITSEPFGSNASPIGSSDAEIEMKLTGPAKFTNLTQSDSVGLTEFDFNGHRLECTRFRGAWDAPSFTTATATGSMLVTTGSPDTYVYQIGYGGGSVDVRELNILFNSDITENISVYWNSSVSAGATGPKSVFTNVSGTDSYTFGSDSNDQQGARTNFIVGAGTYTGYSGGPAWTHHLVTKNLKIANGGTYAPTSDLIKVSGNFNMAGGFIGVGALDLDESEKERVTMGDGMGDVTAVTLEAWVNPSTDPNENTMIGTDGSSGGILSSGVYDKFRIKHESVNGSLTDVDYDWKVNKWQHMCFTWDGTTGKAYADGKLLEEWALSGTPYGLTSACIGSLRGNGDWSWDGKIARASFWKAALTAAEIREMMFYDWAAVSGSSIDQTDCVGWYEFSDGQTATTISDMSGSGNTGTLVSGTGAIASTGGWAGPGTFTYDESTLVFDNDGGTSTLYAPQDGSTRVNTYGLTITSGTTFDINVRNKDPETYGPLVHSGSAFTVNRNYGYHSNDMPIVGASSDLTMGGNVFYYKGTAASGAATDYQHIYNLGGTLTMQGDFTTLGTMMAYGDSVTHFNGYQGTLRNIRAYSSGNFVMEAGSGINFTRIDEGFVQAEDTNPQYITAIGARALYVKSTPNAGLVGPDYNDYTALTSSSAWTQSMWFKTNSGVTTWALMSSLADGQAEGSIYAKHDNDKPFVYMSQADAPGYWSFKGIAWSNPDDWNHLALVKESGVEGTLLMYQNGVLTNSGSSSSNDVISEEIMIGEAAGRSFWDSGDGGFIADYRLYESALTSGNIVTLSSINGAVDVSGAFADSDNSLSAVAWYKLSTTTGTVDLSNYGTSGSSLDLLNKDTSDAYQSGFVTVTGSAPYGSMNNVFENMTLTNTYISGMADVVVGQYSNGGVLTANTDATFTTKGTVVLD